MCLGTQRKVSPTLGHRAIEASLMNAAAAIKQEQQQESIQETSDQSKMAAAEAPTSSQEAIQHIANYSKHHKGAHIIVQHHYHDHSHDERVDYQDEHPARGGVSTPFPLKLHEMLAGVKANGQEHIVSWQPHGRCFVVHKPKEFVELLPHYFKLSKLASFQRQLNLYGFQRLTRGRDRGGYYHELFLRGRVFLAHSIQRIKVKGTGVRARSNPDQEPPFWSMPWIEEQEETDERGILTPTHARSRSLEMYSDVPTSSFVYPGSLNATPMLSTSSSAMPPIVSPHRQKSKLAFEASAAPTDEDIVYAFGDKTFHYLDPFQPLSLDTVTDSSYEIMDAEAESFFRDFSFPENIGAEIENDATFGEMLESLIA